MAADPMLSLPPLPVPAATGCSPAGAGSSAPQTGQCSAGGSAAAEGAGPASSDSSSSSPSGTTRFAEPGNPAGESRSGRRTARAARQGSGASGAPSASSATTAQSAPGADDFSATLAQSLAATPPDGGAAADTAAGKGSAKSGTGQSSEPAAKHSAADPVSTALTLLEHALAGALVGAPSSLTATTASAASASGTSPPGFPGSLATRDGGSQRAVLNALLARNLATEAKAGASTATLTGSASAAATPASTAGTAGAALAAAQLTAAAHVGSPQAKSDPTTMALSSPVGSSAWTDELGAKITWMAHQGIESASLQLTPEHLGPLQVTISVHNGQASVWFGAAQPDTRTALQQSLPQLRQLFANQGLTLADAGVSREPPRGQSRQSLARTSAPVSGVAAVNLDSSAGRASVAGGLGLVDTYV